LGIWGKYKFLDEAHTSPGDRSASTPLEARASDEEPKETDGSNKLWKRRLTRQRLAKVEGGV
jgi:hypothetical protein